MGNSSTINIDIVVNDKRGSATIKTFGREVEAAGSRAEKSLTSLSSASTRLHSTIGATLGDLERKIIAVGSAYLGAQGIGAVIKMADSYSLLESKLKLVSNGQAEFNSNYNELFKISQVTGSSFQANASNFSNLSLALRDTNITSRETLQIFDLVNKSLIVAGASTEEASSFMLQFRQALGSGRLQGEEFRAMMESNSYFGGLLAKALDTDVAGLRAMSKEGKLTTDVLRQAFPEMAQQIDKDFGGIQKTIGRAMQELKNAFGDVINDANKSEQGTSKVAKEISKLATDISANKETISTLFAGLIQGADIAFTAVNKVAEAWVELYRRSDANAKGLNLGEAMTMSSEQIKQYLTDYTSGLGRVREELKTVTDELTNMAKVREMEKDLGGWTKEAEEIYQAKERIREGLEQQLNAERQAALVTKETGIAASQAADQTIASHQKIVTSAEEKTQKIIHLKADERFQVLEMQKAMLRDAKQGADLEIALMNSVAAGKRTQVDTFVRLDEIRARGLENLIKEYEDFVDEIDENDRKLTSDMKRHWEDFGRSTKYTLENVLGDAMRREFDSFGEAWDSVTDAMYHAFTDMIARMIVAWTTSELMDLVSDWGGGWDFSSLLNSAGKGSSGSRSNLGSTIASTAVSYAAEEYLGTSASSYIMSEFVYPAVAEVTAAITGVTSAAAAAASSTSIAAGTATPAIIDAYAMTQSATTASMAAAEGGSSIMASVAPYAGPAAIAAMAAAIMVGISTKDMQIRDRLNGARVTPTGVGQIGGIGLDGQLTGMTAESSEALGLLTQQLGQFEAISVDAANGVMMLADNIVNPESGLIEGINYSIETFDNAAGVWRKSEVKFQDLLDTMTAMGPVSSSAISSTANYVATMAGVPTVADELALAFTQMQTGIYGLAGSAAEASGTIAGAIAMMNSGGGLVWQGGSAPDTSYTPEGYTPAEYDTTFQEPLGHANGGIHRGGWRIVGERGPELEYTPPSQIFSNADSKSILSGSGETAKQIAELKEVLISLGMTITEYMRRSDRVLSRWEKLGVMLAE